jgi:tRNA (cmo5U34)-methyltransferase
MTNIYHVPKKDKWEFDHEVMGIFDDMLSRSIPQYQIMRDSSILLALRQIQNHGTVVDLGCSHGEMINHLLNKTNENIRFVGCDNSDAMIEACHARFINHQSRVLIEKCDLRKDYPRIEKANVVLSILTMQFIPIEYRQQLLSKIYQSLAPKGALILVEKILGNTGYIDDLMIDAYLNFKSGNGYTDYEIQRKRLSLEGVLVPIKSKWNEENLRDAGFSQIDCFWRWMNFSGWIAIK